MSVFTAVTILARAGCAGAGPPGPDLTVRPGLETVLEKLGIPSRVILSHNKSAVRTSHPGHWHGAVSEQQARSPGVSSPRPSSRVSVTSYQSTNCDPQVCAEQAVQSVVEGLLIVLTRPVALLMTRNWKE